MAVDCVYPHKFSTILEVDYDTPYDRHIIIEDSIHRKKRVGKSLEEPEGLGRRILRFFIYLFILTAVECKKKK